MFLYYIITPILIGLSYLPTTVLYWLSDGLAFLLNRVIGYRKKVVIANLKLAFPEKSDDEINQIKNEFYTHLTDRVVEYIKTISLSHKELMQRVNLVTPVSYFDEKMQTKQPIVVLCSHIGAWEWSGHSPSLVLPQDFYGVYTAMSNKLFNDFFLRTRKKYKMNWLATHQASAFLKQVKKESAIYIFISDQSPNKPEKGYWGKLFGVDTNFWRGGVKFAIEQDAALIYAKIIQTKRGFYTIETVELAAHAAQFSEAELINLYSQHLETQIRENPSDWLWSHKRWKHKKV